MIMKWYYFIPLLGLLWLMFDNPKLKPEEIIPIIANAMLLYNVIVVFIFFQFIIIK